MGQCAEKVETPQGTCQSRDCSFEVLSTGLRAWDLGLSLQRALPGDQWSRDLK